MVGFSIPLIVIGATIALSWPLGRYMRWAMDAIGSLRPIERSTGRFDSVAVAVLGSAASKGQNWKAYCISMLVFNVFMFVVVFTIFTTQQWLPLNPDGKEGLEASLAFNTAASFTSNTNLQHYSGEVSMSYLSQLGALMWLQFVSAATGLAAVTALCRGVIVREAVPDDVFRDADELSIIDIAMEELLARLKEDKVYRSRS